MRRMSDAVASSEVSTGGGGRSVLGSRVREDAREVCGVVDAVAARLELLKVGAPLGRGWRRFGGREEGCVIASA